MRITVKSAKSASKYFIKFFVLRVTTILKEINSKNISKGFEIFNKVMQDFGDSMDQLTKELASPKKETSNKDKENLEKLWGQSKGKSLKSDIKIWSDSSKNQSTSQRSRDEINLEKLCGKKKEMS